MKRLGPPKHLQSFKIDLEGINARIAFQKALLINKKTILSKLRIQFKIFNYILERYIIIWKIMLKIKK